MLSAKQIWRTQLAEKVIVAKEPEPHWDAKMRIFHHFILMPESYQLTLEWIAKMVYQNDSKHTLQMVEAALRDMLLHGIFATKTELPCVFYRVHPEMRVVFESIKKEATYH